MLKMLLTMFEVCYAACLHCFRFYCYELPMMLLRKFGLLQIPKKNDVYGATTQYCSNLFNGLSVSLLTSCSGLSVSTAVVLFMGIICVFPVM